MSAIQNIKLVTRQSPLALWQTEYCIAQLTQYYPNLTSQIIKITTNGDKWLDTSLAKVGGKGMFVKELEEMLYTKAADLAVHSLKDVPTEIPEKLTIGAILSRSNPMDAFVSNRFTSFDSLPQGAIIGTSSLRRSSQLLYTRPDLNIKLLRGNVNTRLRKLDEGEYDAIILAAAGLIRLGFSSRICHELPLSLSLPSAGQGALAIESRQDPIFLTFLDKINDHSTLLCVSAERAVVDTLQGGCHAPIAAFAQIQNNILYLTARVIAHDGKTMLEEKADSASLSINSAQMLGVVLAKKLLDQGAYELIRASQDFIRQQI